MKKLCVVAVCTLLSSSLIYSQTPNVRLGAKAGINVASLNVESGGDYNSRVSLNAGLLAHMHVTHHFAIQPELYFSGQGGKRGGAVLKLGYLNIPVLAQYMAGNGFRLETGPQLGILLAAENKSGDVKVNVKDDLKDADFSWAFGAGYQFPGTGLGIDARYNVGVSNISNSGNSTHNGVFAIGLFYQFSSTTRKL